jgi:hypothetical protein
MFETAVRQDVQKYIQNHDRSSVTYRNQYIEEFEFAETPLTRFSICSQLRILFGSGRISVSRPRLSY